MQVIPFNKKRKSVIIQNLSGSQVFLSNDRANVAANGVGLSAGQSLSLTERDGDNVIEEINGICSAGSADLRVIEMFNEG